jgi:hypothetical protein
VKVQKAELNVERNESLNVFPHQWACWQEQPMTAVWFVEQNLKWQGFGYGIRLLTAALADFRKQFSSDLVGLEPYWIGFGWIAPFPDPKLNLIRHTLNHI